MKYIWIFMLLFTLSAVIIYPASALITGEPFLPALGWGILISTLVSIMITAGVLSN